jgi:hypothetical protein
MALTSTASFSVSSLGVTCAVFGSTSEHGAVQPRHRGRRPRAPRKPESHRVDPESESTLKLL